MRPYLAWLLLFLTTLQWVGGHLYFKVIEAVVVEASMDELAREVALALEVETGLETHVTVLEEAQLQHHDYGYGTPFLFSREVDGKTVYFTIDADPNRVVDVEKWVGGQANEADAENSLIVLARLFSYFVFPAPDWPPFQAPASVSRHNFFLTELHTLTYTDVLLPPPRQA